MNNINEILNKLKEMDYNKETCIAELINYNPEVNFVEPMEQMSILRQVCTSAEENNIFLEENHGEKGGLGFYVKFKKIKNNNEEFRINDNITFEDEETKIEYQKYLNEINEYNRKIANGEKPEKDLTEITDKFKQKFVVNHKSHNDEVELYDEFKNWTKKNDNSNNVYFTCHSDIIGKIDFCKSYKPNIIKISNECLKELKNDEFRIKTEIVIDLDSIRENLDYVKENSAFFQNALEKLFEIKKDLLNEIFSQTLFYVNDWWDNDKDENGDIIDIEYIKKCLDSIDIEISADDKDIYINVYFGIEGLNGEDFLGSHILSALIEKRDNYKIEFNIQ